MSDITSSASPPATPAPVKIGVILADLGKLNVTALKYLIVHLNTLQSSIEFEILTPPSDDPLLQLLREGSLVDRETCREMCPLFRQRILRRFKEDQSGYDLEDRSLPETFVIISLAKFSDLHYGLKSGCIQIQALGNWGRHMAPPSVLEFIIGFLMRQAASFAANPLGKSQHLGTKGCLFDFTVDLSHARYKALQSFVCYDCRERLRNSRHVHLADDLVHVADLRWLGEPTDPHSPAGIVVKLGYDLFLTKGLQPTLLESLRSALRDEATKEIVKFIFAILLAAILLRLGLKAG